MVFLHFALLFACIVYAAKLGGIGVGMAGGLGMFIAVFGFGLKPGFIHGERTASSAGHSPRIH